MLGRETRERQLGHCDVAIHADSTICPLDPRAHDDHGMCGQRWVDDRFRFPSVFTSGTCAAETFRFARIVL